VPITDPASFAGFYVYPLSCDDLQGNILDSVEEYASGSSGLQYLCDGYWQFNFTILGQRDRISLAAHASIEPRVLVHPARKMRALPGKTPKTYADRFPPAVVRRIDESSL